MNEQRILVVEDDPHIAQLICCSLWDESYFVSVAGDGLAAMRAFDEGKFALITVDLMLPMVSGFRLVRYFKRARPDVPVVVVSSLTFQEAEEVARAGADDFVSKPFNPDLLVGKIRYHLSSRSRVPVTDPAQWGRRDLISA